MHAGSLCSLACGASRELRVSFPIQSPTIPISAGSRKRSNGLAENCFFFIMCYMRTEQCRLKPSPLKPVVKGSKPHRQRFNKGIEF